MQASRLNALFDRTPIRISHLMLFNHVLPVSLPNLIHRIILHLHLIVAGMPIMHEILLSPTK